MKKSSFSFQTKLLLIVLLTMLLPIVWANLIFYQVRGISVNRSPLIGINGLIDQLNIDNLGTWASIKDILEKVKDPNPDSLPELADLLSQTSDLCRDIDVLDNSINSLVLFTRANAGKLKELDTTIQNFEAQTKYFAIGSVIMLLGATVLIWIFLNLSSLPLRHLLDSIAQFQNESSHEKTADFGLAINEFENLLQTSKTILGETYSLALELTRKTEPLANISVFSDENVGHFFTDVQEISRSSNYIANTLESTTANIQEVATSAQTIADRSSKAAHDSAETSEIAQQGREAVADTVSRMQSIKDEVLGLEDVIANLNSASKEIGEIVNTITNIAYQTNLLALNAAIEAARAGEHGQGFTVVADEVRKLAEESGEAAEDIGKKIKGMLQKTGNAVQTIKSGTSKVIEGVKVANQAGNNLVRIVASVGNVNQMIQDISNASKEQSGNIESLRASIESISGATRITSEGTKRVAAAVNEQLSYIRQYIVAVNELNTLIQLLSGMLERFNFH